jgi:transglutaminase-like putative cysteine protease
MTSTFCQCLWSAALAVAPIVLRAQAPSTLPRGVASLGGDSIYALAVDSASHAEYASILLLDDAVVSVEADGRSVKTTHQVIQVIRQEAVQPLQERRLVYDADHERLHINWWRVLRPSGTSVSETPALIQESDVPAETVNPVYAHRKVVRVSLSGIAPGTLIDLNVTREQWKPYRPGDFYLRWRVGTETMVRRARLVIDAPKDMPLHFIQHHLDFNRRDTVIGSRKLSQWAKQQVLFEPREAFAPPPDSSDDAVGLDVASAGSWSDIGRWFVGLAADRLRPQGALREKARAVVAHAGTLADSVRALHRWVAQDIRYVEIALGQGGFQPRFPDTVVATGFGDCKDKATLLIDALGVIGVRAFPVLINAYHQTDSTLPTVYAFNHEIVAIERPSGYQYVDPTAELSRPETLPWAEAGRFALVVHPDGKTEEVATPPDAADSNRSASELTGELTTDGVFSGHFELRGSGTYEVGMRELASPVEDSAERMEGVRSWVSPTIADGTIDSLVLFDARDFRAPAVISFAIRGARPTQRSGDVDVLQQYDGAQTYTDMVRSVAGPYRAYPIDAERILSTGTVVNTMHITLPAGWHVRLPPSVSATSAFGTCQAFYRQDDRVLSITHRTVGVQGIYPKTRWEELVRWLGECANDRAAIIMIDHATKP